MSNAHDIALVFSPHWSHRLAKEVIEHFPNRAQVFEASIEELSDRLPKYRLWAEDFIAWRKNDIFEKCNDILKKHNLTAISHSDIRYPPLLRKIYDPPLVLFIEGQIPEKESWCAVVGARQATTYGRTQAFRFGKEIADHNMGIVTGLAQGVDEEVIRGACSAEGSVIAVLAGGHAYQTERERKLKNILLASGGAMVSECTPTAEPQSYFFPIRNRIIAGIAKRTLVIEAKVKSGSLVTAQKALEENREVFALPGPITNRMSAGCHKLIREGATLCRFVHDILDNPDEETCTHIKAPAPKPPPSLLLKDFETKLWNFLKEPRTFDSLVEYAKEKGSEVAGILNIWEIEGYLALKNGRYHLVPL